MLGGALAALLLLGIELLQRRIWGEAIDEGLAPQRSLAWCLAIPSGIGLLLSLIGAQRCAGRLPELGDTLKALRHQPPRGGAGRCGRPWLGGWPWWAAPASGRKHW